MLSDEHLDRAGLGQPRRTLDQQMTVAQQRDQHAIDQMILPDDQAAGVGFELLKLFCDAHLELRRSKWRAIVVMMQQQANWSHHRAVRARRTNSYFTKASFLVVCGG